MSQMDSGDPGPLIRPYALTDGRTESNRTDLALEALVIAVAGAPLSPRLAFEQHEILNYCRREVLSVAELAARLRVPLGVARVLISDLADQGTIVLHGAAPRQAEPEVGLLERVLQGLQQL